MYAANWKCSFIPLHVALRFLLVSLMERRAFPCVSFPFLAVCHGITNDSWASPSVPPTDKSVSMLPPASTEYYNSMVTRGTGKGIMFNTSD